MPKSNMAAPSSFAANIIHGAANSSGPSIGALPWPRFLPIPAATPKPKLMQALPKWTQPVATPKPTLTQALAKWPQPKVATPASDDEVLDADDEAGLNIFQLIDAIIEAEEGGNEQRAAALGDQLSRDLA